MPTPRPPTCTWDRAKPTYVGGMVIGYARVEHERQLIAEADLVVEVFAASGTHHGELMGVASTGKTLTLRGVNVLRIKHGRIVERSGRLDQLAVLQQLGLIPAERPSRRSSSCRADASRAYKSCPARSTSPQR